MDFLRGLSGKWLNRSRWTLSAAVQSPPVLNVWAVAEHWAVEAREARYWPTWRHFLLPKVARPWAYPALIEKLNFRVWFLPNPPPYIPVFTYLNKPIFLTGWRSLPPGASGVLGELFAGWQIARASAEEWLSSCPSWLRIPLRKRTVRGTLSAGRGHLHRTSTCRHQRYGLQEVPICKTYFGRRKILPPV